MLNGGPQSAPDFCVQEFTRVIESRPSLTAERVALRRAAHQVLDIPPVFYDPLALRIVGLTADQVRLEDGERDRVPFDSQSDTRSLRASNRQRRAFIAARSRLVEDELSRLVAHGVDQHVVLGAGLDTFAYQIG